MFVVNILKRVVARQQGQVARGRRRPDHSVLDRIPRLPVLLAFESATRLARLFNTSALRVEQPSVITASDTALGDLAVEQRGTAMDAPRVHESETSLCGSEENQIFAQHAHLHGQVLDLRSEYDRMPVAA